MSPKSEAPKVKPLIAKRAQPEKVLTPKVSEKSNKK